MAEQVNKEQTKDAKQEKITGLSDEQLADAQGGAATRSLPGIKVHSDGDLKGVDTSGDYVIDNFTMLDTPNA